MHRSNYNKYRLYNKYDKNVYIIKSTHFCLDTIISGSILNHTVRYTGNCVIRQLQCNTVSKLALYSGQSSDWLKVPNGCGKLKLDTSKLVA